jgi:hypothetical protein
MSNGEIKIARITHNMRILIMLSSLLFLERTLSVVMQPIMRTEDYDIVPSSIVPTRCMAFRSACN